MSQVLITLVTWVSVIPDAAKSAFSLFVSCLCGCGCCEPTRAQQHAPRFRPL
jgi:hypothetical protein